MPERAPTLALFARATRAKTLPLILSPVAVGAALAFERGATFRPGWFLLAAAGAAAMHLGANAINDFFDERSGADEMARIDRGAILTGSGLIKKGELGANATVSIAAAMFAVGLAAGATLAIARGAAVLWFGLAGAALAIGYVAPPVKYGYRGRGLGELGIFAAFGILPVAGSYYVQAQRIEAGALWAGVVPGLLTTLVLFHHHFLHWRADRAAGKMTPIAILEPQAGIVVSGVGLIAAYVTLTVQVAVHLFPLGALVALVTAVPVAASWARAARDPVVPQHALNLLGATLGSSVLTGIVMTVSLALAR